MSDETKPSTTLGKELNQLVWKLLENPQRTEDETEAMVHAAHASCWHWSREGTVVHVVRGEWLIARIYAILGRAEPALHHARRCLSLAEANGLGDFDIAYAWEGMARALAAAGRSDEAREWLARARAATIADSEDRDWFEKDLNAPPWYGVK